MRISGASSHILNEAALGRLSSDLAVASAEVSSGKRADLGRELGHNSVQVLRLRVVAQALEGIETTNGLVSARLGTMQRALTSVADVAQEAVSDIVTVGDYLGGDRLARLAQASLNDLGTSLNVRQDGVSLFAANHANDQAFLGTGAVDTPPLSKIVDAFVNHFGFRPDDGAALGVTGPQMKAFLDNDFAARFTEPAWSSDWSGAGGGEQRVRIAPQEVVKIGVDASSEPIKQLTSGLALLAALGGGSLGGEARQELMAEARSRIGGSVRGVDEMRADLGRVQQQVTAATASISVARSAMAAAESKWTDVDTAEASLRFNQLAQKLEVSYAITRRLSELTLLKAL